MRSSSTRACCTAIGTIGSRRATAGSRSCGWMRPCGSPSRRAGASGPCTCATAGTTPLSHTPSPTARFGRCHDAALQRPGRAAVHRVLAPVVTMASSGDRCLVGPVAWRPVRCACSAAGLAFLPLLDRSSFNRVGWFLMFTVFRAVRSLPRVSHPARSGVVVHAAGVVRLRRPGCSSAPGARISGGPGMPPVSPPVWCSTCRCATPG